ncbi:MAG: EAL domain-containing protein, partial [Acidimicrobiia bacterium]|nr:EAL domain-containing protein [Acidimicrobiia bacterium]
VVAVLDLSGRFSYISPATQPLLGLSPKDLSGTNLVHLVTPHDREMFSRFWDHVCRAPQGEAVTIELGLLSGKDEPLRADIVAINLKNDSDVGGIAVTIRDVTVRAAFEAKLRHLATHDSLTGLANRELFGDRVGTALERAKRSGKSVGVVFIDLDDFKTINDSLGHLVGDELLQVAATRLTESLRSADTAARLGGDEFAILLEALTSLDDAHRIVDRLQQALRRPVTIEGRSVLIAASMGLVIANSDSTPADLLRNADTAMFNAKNAGKDRTHVFEPSMHVAARSRFDMKADLHDALDRREFELFYQPVMRLSDRSIRGFEALLRWNHPTRGLVLPGEFIPLIEETGQIVPVGRWVMETAVAQAAKWQRCYPELGVFSMGVNLSVRQFHHGSVVDDIAASLDAGPVDPSSIVVEITESVFIGDTEAAVARLEQLKDLGIRLAIDDFGTGYSALGYLQRFQADIVKVDKSFVDPLGQGRTDSKLTNGILELVRGLGISTIAEGVERQDQVLDLLAMDCDLAQGFHLAVPRSASDIERLLDAAYAGEAASV